MVSYRETQIVKGMLLRGDYQHDIAAYFGVNGGRIAEIKTGNCTYPTAPALEPSELPPPGPYMTKFPLQSFIEIFSEAIGILGLAETEQDAADIRAALALAKETLQGKIDTLKELQNS